jgi:hypothetical protein
MHSIYRIVSFSVVASHTLHITFDDGTEQTVDFSPVLEGNLYGPLRDISLFNQVRLDPEVHTLVWPNGADFDPATLHDWPENLPKMKSMAERWAQSHPRGGRART